MRVAVLPLLALTAGACAYKPGSFTHVDKSFPGHRTTVGCLDLAIYRRSDPSNGAVLSYEFGNRCAHPATIDLARVQVLAQTVSGKRMRLAPFDPNWEIRALRIDGRAAGAEAISYPADEPVVEVCVDAASIAQEPTERWFCFASEPAPTLAEVSP